MITEITRHAFIIDNAASHIIFGDLEIDNHFLECFALVHVLPVITLLGLYLHRYVINLSIFIMFFFCIFIHMTWCGYMADLIHKE